MNTTPIITSRRTCPECGDLFWHTTHTLCGFCYNDRIKTDRAWFRGELFLEISCALILALAVTVTTKALWIAVPLWAALAWAASETWRELRLLRG